MLHAPRHLTTAELKIGLILLPRPLDVTHPLCETAAFAVARLLKALGVEPRVCSFLR